jgi:hypothetical protein
MTDTAIATESPELKAKLKACDPEVQNYVIALKKENLKLQRRISKQEAAYLSLHNNIQVRAEEIAQCLFEEMRLIEQAERAVDERR